MTSDAPQYVVHPDALEWGDPQVVPTANGQLVIVAGLEKIRQAQQADNGPIEMRMTVGMKSKNGSHVPFTPEQAIKMLKSQRFAFDGETQHG